MHWSAHLLRVFSLFCRTIWEAAASGTAEEKARESGAESRDGVRKGELQNQASCQGRQEEEKKTEEKGRKVPLSAN